MRKWGEKISLLPWSLFSHTTFFVPHFPDFPLSLFNFWREIFLLSFGFLSLSPFFLSFISLLPSLSIPFFDTFHFPKKWGAVIVNWILNIIVTNCMLYDLRDSLGQVEREKKMKWRKERERSWTQWVFHVVWYTSLTQIFIRLLLSDQ